MAVRAAALYGEASAVPYLPPAPAPSLRLLIACAPLLPTLINCEGLPVEAEAQTDFNQPLAQLSTCHQERPTASPQ